MSKTKNQALEAVEARYDVVNAELAMVRRDLAKAIEDRDAAFGQVAEYREGHEAADVKLEEYRVALRDANIRAGSADSVREQLYDSVACATVEYGEENSSCTEGMAEFLAKALEINPSHAESLIKARMSREVTVNITCTVFGAEHNCITEDEAQSFVAEVLGADEVEGVTVELDGL